MSQPEPSYEVNKKFTQFLVRFAIVEAVLLAAIILAMATDIITVDQMLIAIIAVALLGAGIMVWRMMLLQRLRSEHENPGAAYDPGNSQEHGTGVASPGTATANDTSVNTLDESSAAKKFGDPNA